ncbi:ABC transporter ATP-binding protein [bacterium]|nr:ABC transporter ATP-binding protein [bacterium]
MSDPAIVVKNLTVTFGSRSVLNNVSFSVPRGTTLVILGLSGVGKSTTLRCMVGLQKPTSGEILINNKNIGRMKPKELDQLRKRVGMAFQKAALFDSMTVGENVAFGLREHTNLPEEDIQRIVAEKLAIVDLEGMDHLYPSQISGGMQKRASFARTVATDPDVVLYDEPTSGLDPIISTVINELILELQHRLGATSVVVTHDLAGAMLVAHNIIMLHEGKIVWSGPPQEFASTDNPYIKQFREGSSKGPIRV